MATEWLNTGYRETSTTGQTLNREEGAIPGLVIQSSWQLSPKLSTGLSVSRHQGRVDYSGETQTGRAFTTRTRTRFQELGGWLGYRFVGNPVDLTLLPGLRFRQWDRDIEATSTTTSLETRYRWWMPELALRAEWRSVVGHRLRARVGVFRTTGISARVDLGAIGAGKVTAEPEDDYGQRLSLSWMMPATEALDLKLYAYFERAVFQASDPVSVSSGSRRFSVREPESTQWRRGLGIGLAF